MSADEFGVRHAVSALVVVTVLGMGAASAVADAPLGQYTISAGTVLDNKTKLVWQRAVAPGSYTWTAATSYCTNNTAALPGAGWRLPSVSELLSIVDDSRSAPAIDPSAFPSTPPDLFWTSSPYQPSPSDGWAISFSDGYSTTATLASYSINVRCVR